MATGLYHINPETGDPAPCKANIKCPFGGDDDHYTSKEAAREAYEKRSETEKEKALKAWTKKKTPAPTRYSGSHEMTSGHGRIYSYTGHGYSGHGR